MTSETRICGAKTKDDVCMNEPLPGKTRCRLHGGMSTGAKTLEGRARQADANRARWAEIKLALAAYRNGASAPTDSR